MAIQLLHTVRSLKPQNAEVQELQNATQKEFDNIVKQIKPSTTTTTTTVAVGGTVSPSSTTIIEGSANDRAGQVGITSVVDQFIPFSSAPGVPYELTVWFMDNLGDYANIGVLLSDQLANGFWLRAKLIPITSPATSGFLFYIAKAQQ